jgi:His-Xaa-Ser system protein HxsD
MRRMLHMRLMPQVVENTNGASSGIAVDFESSIQSIDALDAAAYRLIGIASCQIDRIANRYVCRLTPSVSSPKRDTLSADGLKERFLNLVADENLRARVAAKTEGVRNVILALAFGSLAAEQQDAG